MRFSVVVPAYNVEKYLFECLQSVTAQSFQDFELIVVDDGSTDLTGTIADDFATASDKVKVVHKENQGLLLARRKGLALAEGDYVISLDGDDCLRADALDLISKAIDRTNADIISFRYSRKSDFSTFDDSDPLDDGFYSGEGYNIVKKHVCTGRFNNLCGKAFRLCRIDRESTYGAYAGLMHGEDLLQLLPIVDASSSLFCLDEALYFYRPNDGASTSRFKPSQLTDVARVNKRLIAYGSKWGDDCLEAAKRGEVDQYIYLEKINEVANRDPLDGFSEIASAMHRFGVFERIVGTPLRFDNWFLVRCLQCGNHRMARAVVLTVELLKGFRS